MLACMSKLNNDRCRRLAFSSKGHALADSPCTRHSTLEKVALHEQRGNLGREGIRTAVSPLGCVLSVELEVLVRIPWNEGPCTAQSTARAGPQPSCHPARPSPLAGPPSPSFSGRPSVAAGCCCLAAPAPPPAPPLLDPPLQNQVGLAFRRQDLLQARTKRSDCISLVLSNS